MEGGPVAEGGATAGDGRQTTGGSAASGDPYDSIGNLGLAANHPNLKYKPFEYAEGERHTKYKKTAEEEEAERAALAAAEAARRYVLRRLLTASPCLFSYVVLLLLPVACGAVDFYLGGVPLAFLLTKRGGVCARVRMIFCSASFIS